MKSSAEIRGLKIININEGKQISTVKDIIINSEDGSLAFFVIDQPSDYFGARLIAYADILGLGDYALIINDSTVVQDVAHNDLAVELLKKDVKVVGSQVLTTRGCLIGQVKEILFDEKNGKISACEVVDPQGKCSEFKCDHVITYGKEIILIDDNPSAGKQVKEQIKPERNKALESPESSSGKESSALSEKELLKKKIEQFGKSESLLKTAENNETIIYPEDFNVFEQRQLQFLLGKTLNNDIQLENGTVLKAGEQITGENLSGVKNRSTLMQLTAHVVK
ncbi:MULTISPECIES: PRC-barrel domain-containing protein [unclassified Dehalobacter]|uniref:PRC-barrel domain-containing protein n=1 Tax=unclassified Dehalobacter TaxID=2635733 RepID=UPI000E6CAC9F|nr:MULTISPECIES: PRC-barrel domain-containing protein [unclassified Dehalobacter]RJE48324.1 hypothetical protein A7K50_10560 [Dehalobacter sp. MCB1]TCX50392.1 hypothetical protein C1I36_07455 [Dehalobacter sp. 14DCB1]TCX52368.1 hypothetical protein C1I38_10275 [Dehalobacter sp. 12DCB1]